MVYLRYVALYEILEQKTVKKIYDITGTHRVALQYGFSNVFVDYKNEKVVFDICGTEMASLQQGFSCDPAEQNVAGMLSGKTGNCMAFLQYEF